MRFTKAPAWTAAGQNWVVSLPVEIIAGVEVDSNGETEIYGLPYLVPIAEFTANTTEGESPLTVSFEFTSTPATEAGQYTPKSFLWTFGDGDTSEEENPTHVFDTAGTYTVSLTVANSAGTDTEEKTNFVSVQQGPAVADAVADAIEDTVSKAAYAKTTLTITASTLLSNDTNSGGDHSDLSITSVANGSGCTVTLSGADITVTYPNSDGGCDASFDYTIENSDGSEDTATVTIDACESCGCSCGCSCDI